MRKTVHSSPLAIAFWALVAGVCFGVSLRAGWLIALGLVAPVVGLLAWLLWSVVKPVKG